MPHDRPMAERTERTGQPHRTPWRRVMTARDPGEEHRAATALELFFDLCFVVAVSLAATQLHHSLAEGQVGHGLAGYLPVFFAHLVGVDELHLVRLRLRHRRPALPADDPGADRRGARARRGGARRVRRRLPGDGVRLRGHAPGDGRAVAACRRRGPAAPGVRVALRRGHHRRAGRLGRVAGAPRAAGLLRRVRARRTGRAGVGRAHGADGLAPRAHRRAVRAVHPHRARRVGARGHHRDPVGVRARATTS